jgi:DNA polymerase III epsilon subunit-like protein
MTLIRFSLISQNEVLVDSLVNPEQPVVDMRTGIHGITEAEVVGVQFTLRHAQAIMQAYCGEGSVIVGHALYNDLRTLKFRHK